MTPEPQPAAAASAHPILAGEVVISPVKTAADRKAFILFQYEVYGDHPAFVPPLVMDRENVLNPKKNPWFDFGTAEFFLARRGGKIVGRIAAIEDPRYNEFHGEKCGWFGFFECFEDQAAATALLQTAEAWVKARGLSDIMGPASFSSNGEWGFLVDSFDRAPAIMMPYNPAYYLKLVEAAGYGKRKDLWAWDIDVTLPVPEKVARIAEKVKKREGVTIRQANLKNWDAEVRLIKELYNAAWEKNWGFVPMTDKEFDLLGKELKMVLDPAMVLFAEVDGKAVGFVITVPDANQAIKKANGRLTTFGLPIGLVKMLIELKRIRYGRLIALGVRKEFRKRGLDSLLVLETFNAGKRLGWTGGEISWTLEDNDMVNRVIEVFGSKRSKTYRIYGKALSQESVKN